jgi:hypothetical protein
VEARRFEAHSTAASSLPARQPNGVAHVGQPVPTYSTVLLAVRPHVVTVKVPPSATASPRNSAYTSREPGKNVLKPAAQDPDVYMPGLPDDATASAGIEPLGPVSETTLASPRQMGGVADGERVRVDAAVCAAVEGGVRVLVTVAEGVPVAVAEGVPVAVEDAVPVEDPVIDGEAVTEGVYELVRVVVGEFCGSQFNPRSDVQPLSAMIAVSTSAVPTAPL